MGTAVPPNPFPQDRAELLQKVLKQINLLQVAAIVAALQSLRAVEFLVRSAVVLLGPRIVSLLWLALNRWKLLVPLGLGLYALSCAVAAYKTYMEQRGSVDGWRAIPINWGFRFWWYEADEKTSANYAFDKSFGPDLIKNKILKVFDVTTPTAASFMVLLTGPELAKWWVQNVEQQQHKYSMRQDGRYMPHLVGDNIFHSDREDWRRFRKVINHLFKRAIPAANIANTTKEAYSLIDRVASDNGVSRVNFQKLMKDLTAEVVGREFYGLDFGILDGDRNNIMTLNEYIWWACWKFRGVYKYLQYVPPHSTIKKSIDEFHRVMLRYVTDRQLEIQADPALAETNDLVTVYANALTEGVMSEKEVKHNMVMNFSGGHDNTAFTLVILAYHLALNPEIQEKARQEAIEVLNGSDVPDNAQVNSMPYIKMCIKEALRHQCPVMAPGFRPTHDQHIEVPGGYTVPPGEVMIFNFHAIHHDPAIWPEPEKFIPERFAVTEKPYTWLPFGFGQRKCPAVALSFVEITTIISLLLTRYSFALPADSIHRNGTVPVDAVTSKLKDFDIELTRLTNATAASESVPSPAA
ncbi:cytochrome P450-dit2 [Geranomyces variabilis]|uniref:Cytochrome P450-dit2 n=1 Tax=Geranomyces variabilis TaxID=109894 RepID=A0AAD5TCC4_9FUNG|nr:cytochrome P450-dit2 [Geranomyces variabilis]